MIPRSRQSRGLSLPARRCPRRRRAGVQLSLSTLLFCLASLAPWADLQAENSVARTVHNLTPTGPGALKGSQPGGVCVYCHTPHNANPTPALWNRDTAGVSYQIYASDTMLATVHQPTNSSRLCLSCHDGILALAGVRVPGPSADPSLGPMRGPAVLGTDLRNSHPISFVYDGALAAKSGELVDPASLPAGIHVDSDRELQCTSCHDPHEDRYPHFLRLDNSNGALCTACHLLSQWHTASHGTSQARWNGAGTNPWPAGAQPTVAANGCLNCHRTHFAPQAQHLLLQSGEVVNCTVCHAGTVAAKNIAAEFESGAKVSAHPITASQWTHRPNENPATMTRHVTCADCHNPHTATQTSHSARGISGPLQGAIGVNLSGVRVAPATADYQVCIKCHDPREPSTPGATRVEATRSVRVKINPGNASFHPIVTVGRNPAVQGLLAGYTASSIIGCGDCHNNSDPGPRGAHASRFAPILERNYVATDPTPESPISYDICYKCHDRNALVSDSDRTFPHKRHVVNNQAPCAVCHDAHGSRGNAHLINFMSRDATGRSVVTPNRVGRLEYITTSPGKGSCYLKCHGVDHNPLKY